MIKCIETNKEYQSAAQAAKELGITQAAISMCINGKRKKANGFTFIKLNTLNNEKLNKINNEEINKINNEEKLNTLNTNSGDSNTNKNDWFTRELENLEAENQTTKIDTQLIKSIIIPYEDNIEPLIDKDALLLKYERERIDRQLNKYIKLPIAHELKEQMILAFYNYVKNYSSSYVDKLKELEQENKSLQQKNDSLIDKLSTYKSEKDALTYIQQEYDNIINDKSGSYVSETMDKQRKTIEELHRENYKYQCEIDALKKKLESNLGDFTVEYERDILLKKVHELETQLGINKEEVNKENTEPKNGFSDNRKDDWLTSRTFDRPSPSSTNSNLSNPPLSGGQIKSSTKRIKDEEEQLTWDDI